MTIAATARVPTASASRYLQQLCKHWAHKFEVDFTPEAGTIRFPDSVAILAAEPETLVVTVAAADAGTAERMKDVVARHLDRFAFREAPLPFAWETAG